MVKAIEMSGSTGDNSINKSEEHNWFVEVNLKEQNRPNTL